MQRFDVDAKMEKFAVDLDAVLDEFEFHEDQQLLDYSKIIYLSKTRKRKKANQSELLVSPSVSGFYSPCSGELGRSSLDLIPVASEEKNLVISTHSPPSSNTRYDAPFKIEQPTAPEKEEEKCEQIISLQNHDFVDFDATEDTNVDDNVASDCGSEEKPVIITKSLNIEPVDLYKNDARPLKSNESRSENEDSVVNKPVIKSDSIKEENKFIAEDCNFSQQNDTSSNEIKEYSPQNKDSVNDFFYVREAAFSPPAEYKTPVKVNSKIDLDISTDNSDLNMHEEEVEVKKATDDYVDMEEVELYLKELEDEKTLKCEIDTTPRDEIQTDRDLETGARPKQRSLPLEEQSSSLLEDTNYSSCDQLNDCIIPESELKATISPNLDLPESPPPYSEVDPNSASDKPNRPVTLDLESSSLQKTDDLHEGDDSPVSAGDPVLGAPGETPANPSGPRLGQTNILDGLSEDQLMFGKVQPFWVPDAEAPNCMICSTKFTVVKRRHHCRSCGKVLCSNCCGDKYRLVYMEGKEGRVCTPCKTVLERLDRAEKDGITPSLGHGQPNNRPNPSNPMEYCSRIPVADQITQNSFPNNPPSVMVPVGVLKRNVPPGSEASGSDGIHGATASTRQENKSVMFSDGIRPGGDLSELDGGSEHRVLGKRPGKSRPRRIRTVGRPTPAFNGDVCKSRMPPTGLPYVSGRGKVEDEEISVWFSAGTFVNFVLNNNLTVLTKKVDYAPINKPVWNFASRGLTSVGQDEVVILLEVEDDEALPPRDIYVLIQTIYEQAGAGRPLLEMGYITVDMDYLGSNNHGGWLFIRHTFQAVSDLFLPNPPVLFGILVMRTEIPWARVFPLRLMLRLGAEYRYYPSPLVSTRYRKPVYREIGHTIMNVLADFKNYAYTLPTIRGLVIHMSPAKTVISIPKNRHEAVCKALNNSNDPVLTLGANFSMSVDSHLVAIQSEDGSYQTQAINILNKERVVTGASFVVFNGSLKSTSNLTAKSSIVEDGIMVQVLPDNMLALRKKLQDMEDIEVGCGPVSAPVPDETVIVKWVDEDKAINIGIKSFIDGKAMDGVQSLRIHSGPDMRSDTHLIRWTELFLIKHEGPRSGQERDPTRIAEGVARAVGVALTSHLHTLKEENCTPLSVRITLDQDNVCYEAGADGKGLATVYMNNLDSELVPLLHSSTTTMSLILELVFHVLEA